LIKKNRPAPQVGRDCNHAQSWPKFFCPPKFCELLSQLLLFQRFTAQDIKSSDTASGDILGSALKHASNDFCGGLAIG
jgi:hypothetical protein